MKHLRRLDLVQYGNLPVMTLGDFLKLVVRLIRLYGNFNLSDIEILISQTKLKEVK